MRPIARSLILAAGLLLLTGMARTSAPALADASTEACSGDNPLPCLTQHGEAAAQALAKVYADRESKLDAACSEVIGPGVLACLERALAVADKRLNESYLRAMKSIPGDGAGQAWRGRLKTSQQAWLQFRDADCGDLITAEMGSGCGTGTGTGAALLACQLGKTEARTAELDRRYGAKP